MENNSKPVKRQSFVERVMSLVKGGDEAKLSRFSDKLSKYFAKQVKMREEKIESLNDQIVDAKETLDETITNVDLDSINKGEGAEGYCPTYVARVKSKLDAVTDLEEKVEALQKEITEFKRLAEAIFG